MLKSNDRFARQNRCRHPPEFPLASSCSSIVHHLSGPSTSALPPRHRQANSTGRRCARTEARDLASASLTCLHFRFARGAKRSPFDSRTCWTPWSVFQDGSDENPARTRWTQGAEVRRTPPSRSAASRPQRAVTASTVVQATRAPSLPEETGAANPRSLVQVVHADGPYVLPSEDSSHRPEALLPHK